MSEEHKSFDYEKAKQWVFGWVVTVDNPQLTWSWDVVVGIIDVYAAANLTPKNSMSANRRELWHDWFNAWQDGEAHYGIHGAMQEFANACPEEYMSHQVITLNEAYEIGMNRKLVPKGKKREKPEVKPTAPMLRVVVDNTATKGK